MMNPNYFRLGRFRVVIQFKASGSHEHSRLIIYVNSDDSYMIHRSFVDYMNGVAGTSRCIEFEAEVKDGSSVWSTIAIDLESVAMVGMVEVPH